MEEGTEIIENIPMAPPLPPPGRPKNCKIVIASGKVEEGYCIVGEELTRSGENYVLPGTKIVIDKISANLFRYPDIKAFVAVGKTKDVYALKPLRESDYKKYVKGELSSKDVEVKYELPESKYEGAYGSVTIHPTEEIAVKKSKSEGGTGELEKDMVVEIGCYRLLSQIACLPRMYNFTPGVQVHIEFEKGQVLSEVMEQNLDLNTKRALMFRAAKCLRTIASQGCIHCDLKPPNMVVSSSGQVLIIDWGMAKIDQSKDQQQIKDTRIQTIWWRSPEILMEPPLKRYTCAVDIFPLGLIFGELYRGYQGLIPGESDLHQQRTLLRFLLDWKREELTDTNSIITVFNRVTTGPSVAARIKQQLLTSNNFFPIENKTPMPEELADLISRMLEFNPIHRIGYDEIVIHPFFQYMSREGIPKMPIFVNNMPNIPSINSVWTIGEQKMPRPSSSISPGMRMILMDWILELCFKFKVGYDTFCLSWQLMDLYMMSKKDKAIKPNLAGYGCAAMMLALKIHDRDPPEVREVVFFANHTVFFADHTYKTSQLVDFETDMMGLLNGNVIIPSLYSYYSHYKGIVRIEKGTEKMRDNSLQSWSVFTKRIFDAYSRDDVYSKPFPETWKKLLLVE